MSGCIDCVWAVAILDKDGNQAFFRCTQPDCKNGEYSKKKTMEKKQICMGMNFDVYIQDRGRQTGKGNDMHLTRRGIGGGGMVQGILYVVRYGKMPL